MKDKISQPRRNFGLACSRVTKIREVVIDEEVDLQQTRRDILKLGTRMSLSCAWEGVTW
jgi:hypothetical protein